MLRRLLEENLSLMRELEELRTLRLMAHQDPSTGLPNRRLFEERLIEELSRSARDSTSRGSLLAVDVNDLKYVNDKFGHSAGDHLLRDVADIVRGALRASDVCCRTGGDEFMILLPDTDARGARLAMARLRVAVIREGSRQAVPIGISIGSATWPTDSSIASDLVGLADRAMYAEKRRLRRHARRRRPTAARALALVK
ncbi:MAG: GGDEF domain-containing protein [Deltaproteobacteria bacterium]|nr:GGDEF domain-containing protein [Deltaproteobacteria bacterium]